MMKLLILIYSLTLFQLLMIVVNCRNELWKRINGREMNARDLVGLTNEHKGLDFDITSHKHTGLTSTKENLLSFGAEKSKKVVVDGVTYYNENIRIEEGHMNKFKFSPFSSRNLVEKKGPIEYENSKTTNLQIGNQFIEKRYEDKLGNFLTESANGVIVHAQEKIIKKALKIVVKKIFN